jgi:aspartyl-tRNA synthetase
VEAITEATAFNKAETLPFEIIDEIDTREEIRLQYRHHPPAGPAPAR